MEGLDAVEYATQGLIIADYWTPSEAFHQQNEKGRIIVNWKNRVKLPVSNKPVSGITGEAHSVSSAITKHAAYDCRYHVSKALLQCSLRDANFHSNGQTVSL